MAYISQGNSRIDCWSLRPQTSGNLWPVPIVAAEEWNVPGIDGKGIGLGSMNDPECEVECTQYGTTSDMISWLGQFDNLLGETCTMVSNLNQTRNWVVVLEVSRKQMDARLSPGENIQQRGLVLLRCVVKYKYTRRPGKLSSFVG